MDYDITSSTNDRIKRLVRLRDRKHRDQEGVFVVEGRRLIRRALEADFVLTELFSDGTTSEFEGHRPITVTPQVLDKASYRQQSQGMIGVFTTRATALDAILLKEPPLVLIAEAIEKPGNLGAMLRTADACRADAMIVVGRRADLFNPNTIRASTGALFRVPTAEGEHDQVSDWLRDNSIELLGASPEAPRSFWNTSLTGGVALMVGAEDHGLSQTAIEKCDTLVSIPMAGSVDSLNASVSLALLAFEAVRQRSLANDPVDG